MMAKKRRRRRVDGAKPAPAPAPGTSPPKAAAAASPAAKQEEQDADEDGDEDDGVALPPMPSELGRGAVMAAQVRMCKYRQYHCRCIGSRLALLFWLRDGGSEELSNPPPPSGEGWVCVVSASQHSSVAYFGADLRPRACLLLLR